MGFTPAVVQPIPDVVRDNTLSLMTSGGLSNTGTERLRRVLAGHVQPGVMPGLVALVSRDHDTHVDALGTLAFDNPAPMQRDTIFRLASITKLVTAVAAMMLVEDCRIRLDDAIDPWVPELANRRVLRSIGSDLTDTVPANRAITLRDVLTYRMGFGSVMAMPGTHPIQQPIRELHIGGDGPMRPTHFPPVDEWLRRLGSLPLMAQPGERWLYHVSGDVLGALVARVSGQTLGTFMQKRIFEPLGMADTSFFVPREKRVRLSASYWRDPQTGALQYFDDPNDTAWSSPSAFESGGGGLVSTIDDYFAFTRMLLHGGRHGREQLLSPATVSLMTSDQLRPEQRAGSGIFFGNHSSWGLGIAVDIAREEIYHAPGRYGWTGGFGTTAYTDPAQGLIGILFTQRAMESPNPPKVFTDFWTAAYGAIA